MTLDTLISLAICLVLAGVLGVAAQRLLRMRLGGLFVSVFLGFVGACLGKATADWLRLHDPVVLEIVGRQRFPLLWSCAGALAATLIVAAVASRKPKAKKK